MFTGTKKLVDLKAKAGDLGTKDLDELLDLAEEGLEATAAALADGTANWKDLPKFAPVVGKIKPAFEGITNVWPEVKDLDATEAGHVFERMTTIIALVGAVATGGSVG